MTWQVDPTCQCRVRGEGGYQFGARGLLGLGQLVSPRPFHIFLFLFFISLLICFIEFANWIQINSNKILKYSIVHCIISK
jgi:hypothetical protein